ncbi:uncharacterized protein PV06_00539 [Exophiala oligosperma]|uniref:sarcosine oxidasee (formaldehyde-forming) n=1 Tax=Exophiala oligosperma TaxID=215243 RepID=A0A0D2DXR1_9EURO|nr:uncharacterized protein PV06_00539 [Exophiala oligosperma]KIW47883.1 hypothetical protein PV06_00539 [Exophiala oligosperma]
MAHFDVAVIGLGALGSGAAYYSALKGAKVIGFEQFELGHVHGASHDTSRIVRTSYDSPEYVALAKTSYKDWADVERAAGHKLLHQTGGLIFVPKNGQVQIDDYTRSLGRNQVPYELLSSEEVRRRWPQFRPPHGTDAVYTPDTGMVHASRSVAAMQNLARNSGAVLKEYTRVESIKPQRSQGGRRVEIVTSQGRFYASKVIVAADAWTNKLLEPLGVSIPLRVSQEQVTYYKPSQPGEFGDDKFPVWIYFGAKAFYGFPTFGEPTIKAARDEAQNYMTPERRSYVHSQPLLDELTSFMDAMVPDSGRQTLRTVTCQYTVTPDRQFVISPLRNHPDVIVLLGAAHGFKFAPTFGRVAAELALDGETVENITTFGIPEAGASFSESKL